MASLMGMLFGGRSADWLVCAGDNDDTAESAYATKQDTAWLERQSDRDQLAEKQRVVSGVQRFKAQPTMFGRAPSMWVETNEKQNAREYMEDTHDVFKAISGDTSINAFGVFDGHGGDKASKFCSKKMLPTLDSNMQTSAQRAAPEAALRKTMQDTAATFDKFAGLGRWHDGTTAIVVLVHNLSLVCGNVGDCRAVLGRRAQDEHGDNVVSVHVQEDPTSSRSRLGQVGNAARKRLSRRKSSGPITQPSMHPVRSEPMLVRPNSSSRSKLTRGTSLPPSLMKKSAVQYVQAIPLSKDHKPGSLEEKHRIRLAGGTVCKSRATFEALSMRGTTGMASVSPKNGGGGGGGFFGSLFGTVDTTEEGNARLPDRAYPGGLSVSRTIGDLYIKAAAPGVVSAMPDVRATAMSPERDLFVIIASDGVWDVFSNEEACRLVCLAREGTDDAACKLVDEAIRRGSRDNCTAMVIHFDWSLNKDLYTRRLQSVTRTNSGNRIVRFSEKLEVAGAPAQFINDSP